MILKIFHWPIRLFMVCMFAGVLPLEKVVNIHAQSTKNKTLSKKAQASAYAKRGSSKAKKKDYSGALKDYQKAYRLNPSSSHKKRVQQLRALVKKRAGKPTNKNKKAAQAIAYVKRGNDKAKKKDFAGALMDFKRSYKLNPSNANKKRIQKVQAILKNSRSSRDPLADGKVRKVRVPSVDKIPILNTLDFITDIYNITEAFEISSRQLSRATSYLQPAAGKKITFIERSSTPTLEELELSAREEPNDIRRQVDLARSYEAEGSFDGAKDIYLRLVSQNQLNPDTHFYLGSFFARFRELNKARQSFEEALDINPSHLATIEAMAAFFGKEDFKELNQEVLNHSIALDPEGPAQRIQAIQKQLEEGNYLSAAKLAAGGQGLFPSHSGFIYLKGKAFDGLGDTGKAKAAYRESIKKDPTHVESYLALGELYFTQGKYIYAALSFGDGIRLNPGNIEVRYKQGLSYYRAYEWGLAAGAWEDLLHYDSHNRQVLKMLPQAYYILAVEYNRTGKSGLGQSSFRKALSINKNSGVWLAGSMSTLGRYYREKGMFRESLTAYQEVIELKPKDASSYLGLGITYWKMKESVLARAAWQRSLELNPRHDNNARGWLLVAGKTSG